MSFQSRTVHVEFKAGRMTLEGKMVKPELQKGKLTLFFCEEEQLMRVQWQDRESGKVELDLIVINDVYLQRVEQCKTGRVYILRSTSSDQKHFFWMQEPKEDEDIEKITRFNEVVGAKIPEKGAAKQVAAPTDSQPSAPAVDPQLRQILTQILQAQAGQVRAPLVPLNAVLTTEVLQTLLSDETAVAEMITLLPEGQQTPEDLHETLGSAQLQQSLGALTQAIHSDQLAVLFASLGLDTGSLETAAVGTDALELLCRAMETHDNTPSTGDS